MTIKEMESLTGMTRANIRFYESKGLLSPERGENGYREYTEKDLIALQRIKLLRMLDLSLEEIQKLQMGEEAMETVLSRHEEQLQQEGERIARCREVCAQMKADRVQYSTLNADKYLQKVNEPEPETQPEPQWKQDVLPPGALAVPALFCPMAGSDFLCYLMAAFSCHSFGCQSLQSR